MIEPVYLKDIKFAVEDYRKNAFKTGRQYWILDAAAQKDETRISSVSEELLSDAK